MDQWQHQHKCLYPDTQFYDLQEDGTILCDKKADCPADVPDQVLPKHITLSDLCIMVEEDCCLSAR